ncbi:MAG: beta-1,6-N-acetylglucosaminyltransferase [Bacteroides sp.]|nr:beta-1,6-N-acetylglucosaminyltransferase [Bacteroides sp.]
MYRHAFLILAHESENQLQSLLTALDAEGCDVYVHIDAKSGFDGMSLTMRNGQLYILSNRIDCRWGDYSLVEAELNLIEEASRNADYAYLHLISGTDYPLNGVGHIFDYCKINSGKEFIGFSQNVTDRELEWRYGRRFLFCRDFQNPSLVKRMMGRIYASLQSLPDLGRKIDAEVRKGSQWCSITSEFARYVLSRRDWIRKHFSHTYCPDEAVMQTLAWNSRFRDRIFDVADEFRGCMRFIPWVDGCLRPFGAEDFTAMKQSERFFGRKFSLKDIETYERL